MKEQFNEILQKRMDRKDFLKHIAMGVAIITGAAGIVKLMKPDALMPQQPTIPSATHPTTSYGYGASVYGGRQASAQSRQP